MSTATLSLTSVLANTNDWWRTTASQSNPSTDLELRTLWLDPATFPIHALARPYPSAFTGAITIKFDFSNVSLGVGEVVSNLRMQAGNDINFHTFLYSETDGDSLVINLRKADDTLVGTFTYHTATIDESGFDDYTAKIDYNFPLSLSQSDMDGLRLEIVLTVNGPESDAALQDAIFTITYGPLSGTPVTRSRRPILGFFHNH